MSHEGIGKFIRILHCANRFHDLRIILCAIALFTHVNSIYFSFTRFKCYYSCYYLCYNLTF